ncbi:MAG: hypothetical protein N2557_05170 [Hydrogenophilus sp.]|nr:hypothetical protein [Hydrogenophilus sp.]
MSYGLSRVPVSAQSAPHEGLRERVRRHLVYPFRKPYAPYNCEAFAIFWERWSQTKPAVILDAGCGVGWSTLVLAQRNPDSLVVGVDRSAERLRRRKPLPEALWPENLLFLRADLVDFWRLLLAAGVSLRAHWWLYPNPWPKIGHLQRRWYAHPVWPTVVRLGGAFECRTNWRVFAEELVVALQVVGVTTTVEVWRPVECLTPFERKYRDSGQALYRVRCVLPGEAGGVRSAALLPWPRGIEQTEWEEEEKGEGGEPREGGRLG